MIVTRGLGKGGRGALVALGLAVTGTTLPIAQPWDLRTRLVVDYDNLKLSYPSVVTVDVIGDGVLVKYSEGVMSLLPSDGHKVTPGVRAELCVDAGLSLSGSGSARLILV